MNLILVTNNLGYKPFLHTYVDSFIIGLKDFCINQKFCLSFKNLSNAIVDIKKANKQIYLNINLFAREKDTKKLKKLLNKIAALKIDGFIISDLGILNIFKEKKLEHKVILDLQTYVTNKYSAKSLLNLGVNRILVSKEITLKDIKDISIFNDGNIEVLCQGYYPITYSKRPLLTRYYEKYKLKPDNNIHYIKEENRTNYYIVDETNNNLSVYNDKQYSLFPYLQDLISSNIKNFRIDASFLTEEEIIDYITFYKKAIDSISNNNLDEYASLKKSFESKYIFDNPFIYTESFLLKEGN